MSELFNPNYINAFRTDVLIKLKGAGCVVLNATGQSFARLKANNPNIKYIKYWDGILENHPPIEDDPSIYSQVAFHPAAFCLPDSDTKFLVEHQNMVNRYSAELARKVESVRAIIAPAPVYALIIFSYLFSTGINLLPNDLISTTTRYGNNRIAVGQQSLKQGLRVVVWPPKNLGMGVKVAPVIVPA